jgi:hypothetical protein
MFKKLIIAKEVFKLYEVFVIMIVVGALRYTVEDRGFDSRWFHWSFSLT